MSLSSGQLLFITIRSMQFNTCCLIEVRPAYPWMFWVLTHWINRTRMLIVHIDCARGSWGHATREFWDFKCYALRCVLRTYKAPFSCMHIVYIHTLKLVPSLSGFRNTCEALADYAVVFVEWFQKYVWGPSGLCSGLRWVVSEIRVGP